MPRRGQTHTAEARARIAEGVRRGSRPWKDGLKLLPAHVARYAQSGQVYPALRPALGAAVSDVARYADDLGGTADLAAGELLMLQTLVRAKTVINAIFEGFVRTGDTSALEGATPWLLAESRALAALGLKRRARALPSLEAYLATRSQDAEDRSRTTNTGVLDSEARRTPEDAC